MSSDWQLIRSSATQVIVTQAAEPRLAVERRGPDIAILTS
jgi:hypothetical protein